MSEQMGGAPAAETAEDFGPAPQGTARRWVAEIDAFERERRSYNERSEKIVARYRGEQKQGDERRFALLWANVEVLKPTIYARDPVPRVFRRFRDRDPVGRVAATLLERVLACQVEREGVFGQAMRAAELDFLLIGQGVGWVFYEPGESDRARVGHVHWRDFGFTAGARVWEEVTAVWRVAYMTRDQLRERFGEAGETVPLDRVPPEQPRDSDQSQVYGKATIYEVWDAEARTVTWLHKAVAEPLDFRPYPLKLRSRFPCPRPLFATLTTGSTVPVPDYAQYQDQAMELDDLTARIASLSKALRLVGFTAGESQLDLQKGLDSTSDVAVVPVEAWTGAQSAPTIEWLPVREVAETLGRLMELREQIKADAYEVTGLSDILRGSTQASETATAQQIKAQWGSVRVRERQAEMARFARDCIEIMADVVCGHFDPQQIAVEANAEAMPETDRQYVPAALALLKGEGALRNYRVDVETDSTIAPDEGAEREAATELLTGVAGYLGSTMPILQGVAQSAPHALGPMAEMLGGLLTQAARRFRGGEEVEELIERAMQAIAQPPQQVAGPQGPSPEEMAMQAEAAKAQAAQQAAMMEVQARQQIEAGKAEVAMRVKQMELEAQQQAEAARIAAEDRRKAAELEMQWQIATLNAQMKAQDREASAAMERERMGAEERRAAATQAEAEKPDLGAQLATTLEQMLAPVAARIEGMEAQLSAPRELVRDESGRVVGVRVGNTVRQVARGEDGRATGVM